MVYSGLFQLGHFISDLLYGCKAAEEQSAGDQSLFEIGAFLVPLDHRDALLTALLCGKLLLRSLQLIELLLLLTEKPKSN